MAEYSKNFLIQIKDLNNNALFPKTKAALVEGFETLVKIYLESAEGQKLIEETSLAKASAMVFKGAVDTQASPQVLLPTSKVQVGWTYLVSTAGEYAGSYCEPGDMIICNHVDGDDDVPSWSIIQTNINGAVTSTETLTADHFILGSGGQSVKAASVEDVVNTLKDSILAALSISEGTGITISTSTNAYTINISDEYQLTSENILTKLEPVLGTNLVLVTKEVDGQEVQVLDATIDLSALQTDISNIQTDIATAQADIIALGTRIGTAEGSIEALGTSVEELTNTTVALGSRIDTANDSIEALGTRVDTVAANLADTTLALSSSIAAVDDRISTILVEGGAGEKNQKAWSTITVGTESVLAETTTDTFAIQAGTGIDLSVDGKTITFAASVDTSVLEEKANKNASDIEKLYMLHGTWDITSTPQHSYSLSVSKDLCMVGERSNITVSTQWNSKVTPVEGKEAKVTCTLSTDVSYFEAAEPTTKTVTAQFEAPAGTYTKKLELGTTTAIDLGLSTNSSVVLSTKTENVPALKSSSTKTVRFVWPVVIWPLNGNKKTFIKASGTLDIVEENVIPDSEGKVYIAVPKETAPVTFQFYATGQYNNISSDLIEKSAKLDTFTYKVGSQDITATDTYVVYTISEADPGKYKFSVTL